MSDWLSTALTALGSGALGAVITTYGAQTRVRREARSHAREMLRQLESSTRSNPTGQELSAALDNFETEAMLAGISRKLTELNRKAVDDYWMTVTRWHVDEYAKSIKEHLDTHDGQAEFRAAHIQAETLRLLADATWHPVTHAPYRWWRTRQLWLVVHSGPRPGPRPRDKRSWERKAIREAKRRKRSLPKQFKKSLPS